jgi:uncharacterized membrane protein (DUF106 family)
LTAQFVENVIIYGTHYGGVITQHFSLLSPAHSFVTETLCVIVCIYSHFRRKKKNDEKKLLEQVSKVAEVKKEEKSQVNEVKRTKAELAFQKMQEKMVRFLHKLLLLHS